MCSGLCGMRLSAGFRQVLGGFRWFSQFSAVLGRSLAVFWDASCGRYWALSVSLFVVVSGFGDVGFLLFVLASAPDVVSPLLFVVPLIVCCVFWLARCRSPIVCGGFWLGRCRSPVVCGYRGRGSRQVLGGFEAICKW